MLKQSTREKLQDLIQHPEFPHMSVTITDQKIFHASKKGEPTFYTDIDIHTEGESALATLSGFFPEIEITEHTPNRTEHTDKVSVGEFARGRLEGATINYWSTFYEMPKEKSPAPTGATEENILPYITTKVWTTEEILRRER